MTSAVERFNALESIDRNVKRATSYVRKASHLIHAYDKETVPALPTSYWSLLDAALETSVDIIEALPDEFFAETEGGRYFGLDIGKHNVSDEPFERARKVLAAIEARRKKAHRASRIARLEDTTGRTEEEAAVYRAKAAELRQAGEV